MGVMLGFDFDAVLVQTDLILCDILTEKVKRVIHPEDITMYDLQDNVPELSDEDAKEVINELVNVTNTFKMPSYPGAFDFLKWYSRNNPIYIITNRLDLEPVNIYLQHNLDKATYDKVELHHTIHKGIVSKALGITHFIEDKLENIVDLANNGIVPIMLEQNWNKNISKRSNLYDLIYVVKNWEEIYSVVGCQLFGY